jgi:hypothetical protein
MQMNHERKQRREKQTDEKSNKNRWKIVSGKQSGMQGIRGRQKQEMVRRKFKEK